MFINLPITMYWKPFKELFRTDMLVFKQVIAGKTLNMLIWVASNVAINSYLMPFFGVAQSYGPFMVAGTFASIGLFEVFPSAVTLISDMQHDRLISYQLSLPLPSTLVFIRLMCYYFFNIVVMQLITLPLSLSLVSQRISFSAINIPHFLIMIFVSNLFYAGMALFISSKVEMMEKIGDVWMRFLYPLWYLGGYHFSWKALYSFSPALAYLNLLNPMTWLMEGLRGSFFDSPDFLPFWGCVCMVISMFFVLSWGGITRLKKRLDCL